ncbi:MAG: ATP-dependent DNA helicase RecG [Lachnospiraceae bacterium]|nr:ATP-dependent DNA helicase RecG [Lachnospiraceae bacterium]
MTLEDSIRTVKGIGAKSAECYEKLGVRTVGDLLFYYPSGYETFDEPVTVREAGKRDLASVRGVITQVPAVRHVKKFVITETVIRDETGAVLRLTWFNMPYLRNSLKPGAQYVFRGKLGGYGAGRRMEQPKIYKLPEYAEKMRSLQPLYRLTAGLTVKAISSAVGQILSAGIEIPETLDQALLSEYGLMPLSDAVRVIHFPPGKEELLPARRRLVFEEFYRFILNVRRMKEDQEAEPNHYVVQEDDLTDRLTEKLPYALTNAQKRTLREIREDMSGPSVMNRLVQGDVGSGKTIVAFLAMYETALSGYQSALMAPTEVLARQHYENFRELSEKYGLGITLELLTGSMKASEKKEKYDRIAAHQADVVIGTHTLIQEKVRYEDLALVITDEQHRFGVNQRKALSEKGHSPHTLVMSATPIPRTLALILYGDLSISVMDEKPAERLPVKNALVGTDYRRNAWSFIEKQVREGRQAYVICPLVEESEASGGENVVEYTEKLRDALPKEVRVEYMHGKLSNDEKDALMEAFSRNEIQVLVSTTVIEVGIDVPNATVILIENAERFGLAELHQLRGRVGRGKEQSYCILLDTTDSEESRKRLEILKNSNDGFYIAEEDLKLRGPGDFFGIRQSGGLTFRLGDIYTDAGILKEAEEAALRTAEAERAKRSAAVL